MKTVGIICEYNPFHFGHLEQLERVRNRFPDSAVVCLMSGNFVQRGECAVFSKYRRARAAVCEGADLVLELPYPWCASSADNFARAGVHVLTELGMDYLCFGSESGEGDALQLAAERMREKVFLQRVKEPTGTKNESYILRCERVYNELYGTGFPVKPNDILSVCYLRSMMELGSGMLPYIYKRTSPFSATGARRAVIEHDLAGCRQLIPPKALEIFLEDVPVSPLLPSQTVLPFFCLFPGDVESLCSMDGMSPGIPSRMRKAAMRATDTAAFVRSLTSRRDTAAKIRRSILACFTHTDASIPHSLPMYTVLLAANEKGRTLLSMWRKTASFPILTRISDQKRLSDAAKTQFDVALRAEYLYASACGEAAADIVQGHPFFL